MTVMTDARFAVQFVELLLRHHMATYRPPAPPAGAPPKESIAGLRGPVAGAATGAGSGAVGAASPGGGGGRGSSAGSASKTMEDLPGKSPSAAKSTAAGDAEAASGAIGAAGRGSGGSISKRPRSSSLDADAGAGLDKRRSASKAVSSSLAIWCF